MCLPVHVFVVYAAVVVTAEASISGDLHVPWLDDASVLLQTQLSHQHLQRHKKDVAVTVHRVHVNDANGEMEVVKGHDETAPATTVYTLCADSSDGAAPESKDDFEARTETCQDMSLYDEKSVLIAHLRVCEARSVQEGECFAVVQGLNWPDKLRASRDLVIVNVTKLQDGSDVVLVDATKVTQHNVHAALVVLESSLDQFKSPHAVFVGGAGASLMRTGQRGIFDSLLENALLITEWTQDLVDAIKDMPGYDANRRRRPDHGPAGPGPEVWR